MKNFYPLALVFALVFSCAKEPQEEVGVLTDQLQPTQEPSAAKLTHPYGAPETICVYGTDKSCRTYTLHEFTHFTTLTYRADNADGNVSTLMFDLVTNEAHLDGRHIGTADKFQDTINVYPVHFTPVGYQRFLEVAHNGESAAHHFVQTGGRIIKMWVEYDNHQYHVIRELVLTGEKSVYSGGDIPWIWVQFYHGYHGYNVNSLEYDPWSKAKGTDHYNRLHQMPFERLVAEALEHNVPNLSYFPHPAHSAVDEFIFNERFRHRTDYYYFNIEGIGYEFRSEPTYFTNVGAYDSTRAEILDRELAILDGTFGESPIIKGYRSYFRWALYDRKTDTQFATFSNRLTIVTDRSSDDTFHHFVYAHWRSDAHPNGVYLHTPDEMYEFLQDILSAL